MIASPSRPELNVTHSKQCHQDIAQRSNAKARWPTTTHFCLLCQNLREARPRRFTGAGSVGIWSVFAQSCRIFHDSQSCGGALGLELHFERPRF